jgi:membrane protein DedA with SNARE-associated domain
MKLHYRFAALFASGAFLLVGLKAYMDTMNPMHGIMYGSMASGVMAILGYQMGRIMSHPKGHKRLRRTGSRRSLPANRTAASEEVFFSDIPD